MWIRKTFKVTENTFRLTKKTQQLSYDAVLECLVMHKYVCDKKTFV